MRRASASLSIIKGGLMYEAALGGAEFKIRTALTRLSPRGAQEPASNDLTALRAEGRYRAERDTSPARRYRHR